MNGVAKVYEREIDAAILDAYWLALRDWPLEDFEAAAGHLLRSSKFMPRPADFQELRKAGRKTAGEAWEAARACVRYGGRATGDALTDRVVQILGGYRALGMLDSDQMPYIERRFAEHYESLGNAVETREALPQIAAQGSARLNGPASARRLLGNGTQQ